MVCVGHRLQYQTIELYQPYISWLSRKTGAFEPKINIFQVCLNILCCVYRKYMPWKRLCFTLQSMGHTKHIKFLIHATRNDQNTP